MRVGIHCPRQSHSLLRPILRLYPKEAEGQALFTSPVTPRRVRELDHVQRNAVQVDRRLEPVLRRAPQALRDGDVPGPVTHGRRGPKGSQTVLRRQKVREAMAVLL